MKRKWFAVILIGVMVLSLLGGCSQNSETESDVSDDNAIYGEVSAVGEDSITIKVGTMKQMDRQKDDEKTSEGETASEAETKDETTGTGDDAQEKGEQNGSMLELTGEEQEIKITEDTVIWERTGGFGRGNMENSAEMPSGEGEQRSIPEMPSGESGKGDFSQETQEIDFDDIEEGDIVSVTFDEDGNAKEITVISFGGRMGQPGAGQSGAGGQTSGVDSYDAVKEYSSDAIVDGDTFESTGKDENAIHVLGGASAVLSDITVVRNSSNSTGGDNSSFYGVGAALLVSNGTASIKSSKITTDAAGGAGIFAYDQGTVYAADTTIKTTQDTSGGIHAAGGGTLYAWDMNVTTSGESSAAIRSDRGGGKMVVDGGTYVSKGTGSPAIYSTADIAVNDAKLTAKGSEAICIEGRNSIRLYDSELTGNMSDNEQNDCTWNVILYQSMSGDSEVGNSTFEMNGGSLTAKNGGMFYTTNTESTFILKDVDITYAKDSEFFLKCTGNGNQRGWGTTGSNGADCSFTAIEQEMKGDVIWDSVSNLDFYMTDQSTLKGAVKQDESNAGDGGDGYCNIYIEKGSVWTVTGDSNVTKLYNGGIIQDADGRTVTVKGSDGTVYVKGSSEYTITVDSYETKADLSGASSVTSWSDYKAEKPDALK